MVFSLCCAPSFSKNCPSVGCARPLRPLRLIPWLTPHPSKNMRFSAPSRRLNLPASRHPAETPHGTPAIRRADSAPDRAARPDTNPQQLPDRHPPVPTGRAGVPAPSCGPLLLPRSRETSAARTKGSARYRSIGWCSGRRVRNMLHPRSAYSQLEPARANQTAAWVYCPPFSRLPGGWSAMSPGSGQLFHQTADPAGPQCRSPHPSAEPGHAPRPGELLG